jgi:ATP-dependent Lhr-like helicase
VFRQLERRGEIRGGRFIAQVAGEQFAAEETVGQLRQVRDLPANEPWVVLSAADPLNLLGILVPGGRLPATHGGTLILEAGRYLAARSGSRIEFFTDVPIDKQAEYTRALLRGRRPPSDHEDAAAKRFADRLARRRAVKEAQSRQSDPRRDIPKPAPLPAPGPS